MYATGKHTYKEIGETFGVSLEAARKAIMGKNWGWVKEGL
jgi:hypothetical protein